MFRIVLVVSLTLFAGYEFKAFPRGRSRPKEWEYLDQIKTLCGMKDYDPDENSGSYEYGDDEDYSDFSDFGDDEDLPRLRIHNGCGYDRGTMKPVEVDNTREQ